MRNGQSQAWPLEFKFRLKENKIWLHGTCSLIDVIRLSTGLLAINYILMIQLMFFIFFNLSCLLSCRCEFENY